VHTGDGGEMKYDNCDKPGKKRVGQLDKTLEKL